MNFKKTLVLLSLSPLLLTSCSSFGSHYVVRDLDAYFSDSLYQDFTIEKVQDAMKIGHEFLVYIASSDCSSCQAFAPEFEPFLKEHRYLTYKFDAYGKDEEKDKIIETFKEKFCQVDAKDRLYMSFPSVFIVKGEETEEIPYKKLKNTTMISNTFNEYVHANNVFFAEGDVINKMVNNSSKMPFRDFGYLAFDFTNESLLSYFQTSLLSYINELSFPVVVTNFAENEENIYVKKGVITEDGSYGSKAETMSKDSSNLEYVKEVLNK